MARKPFSWSDRFLMIVMAISVPVIVVVIVGWVKVYLANL